MISSIDIILLIALLAFVVHGFSKGLVSKLLSLAAILLGIIIAAKYSQRIALIVHSAVGGSQMTCAIIGIVLLFVVLLVIASVLTKMFKSIKILQIWDKFGGAIFGLLEGALMLSILLLILSVFDIPASGASRDNSYLYGPVKNFAGVIYRTFVTNGSTEKTIDKFFSKAPADSSSTK